jgi:SAM-dependent methyltransferase
MFLRENEVGRRLAPHLAPGESILDLGSGTGLISRWLAGRVAVRPVLTDLVDYSNRRRGLPFIRMEDPYHVPAEDRSFDAVLLLFALHHNPYEAQGKVLDEGIRLTRRRLIVMEDTPTGAVDRAFNVFWDRALNLRHGVPVPCAFRGVDEWVAVFEEHGLRVRRVETYRPMWPTLGTYHHSLFVLDRD